MNSEERLEPALRRLSCWSLIITVAISASSLIGWVLGATILTSVKQYYIPIAPSTALCFFIVSISFLIYVFIPNTLHRTITAFCASLTILIASILLISFFMGIIIKLELLGFVPPTFQNPYQSGHMSPFTAVLFIVASLGVLLLCLPSREKQLCKNAASFMALSVCTAGFIMIIGYLHGRPLLYGGTIIPVAFPTSVAFVFLGLGIILASGSSVPAVRIFAGSSLRSRLTRAFLPVAIASVLISDLIDEIELSPAVNPVLASSITAIVTAAIVGIIIAKIAKSIGSEIDQANSERDENVVALRESEERYRDMIENSSDLIQSVTPEGRFIFVNPAWRENLGYTEEELSSLSLFQIIHPDSMAHCQGVFQNLMSGQSVKGFQATFVSKDGRPIIVEGNVVPRMVGAQVIATHGFFRDITERKQAEKIIQQNYDTQAALNVLLRLSLENISLEEILKRALDLVLSIPWLALEAQGGIFLVEDEPDVLVMKVQNNLAEPIQRMCARVPFGKCFCGRAASMQKIQFSDHLDEQHEIGYEGMHPHGHYCVPILSAGRTIGVITLYIREGHHQDQKEEEFLTAITNTLAGIIERKRAEEELQQTLENLRKAFGTTVQVMVSAVESRDPYTAGHQLRVADLARAIATEMGLPREKIDGIRMAGSIHDIGKLSIPAEILSRPTKLTNTEFSLIKEHSQKGYEILKDVESPWPLAQIVYQHHERIDGSGYPRNLKGEEILMEARIMAVADVVESMASHRPYRPSLGIDAALAEIVKNRGTLYDEAVVDACLILFRGKGFQLKGE